MQLAPKRPRFEDVPTDASAAFVFREFQWDYFPFNWHYHPHVELTLVVRGRGLRFVGDSVEPFREGDLCLLGANTPHCWASQPGSPPGVRSLVVQFSPEAWGDPLWSLPELRKVRLLFSRAQRGLAITGPTRQAVGDKIQQMLKQPHGSWARLSILFNALVKIAEGSDCRELAHTGWQEPKVEPDHRRLGQILGYIHANAGPDLQQQQVAQAARMSPQAFSQFFKRSVGKTFVAYVNELKVRRACHALMEDTHTITEVAYAAGFNNLSHFNSRFRRLMKMTPRDFRYRAREALTAVGPQSANDWLGKLT